MMFDNTKLNMNVNMDGKEYIEYRKVRQLKFPKLSKKTKKALPYFAVSLVGVLLLTMMIQTFTRTPPPKTLIDGWYESMPIMVTQSWSNIAKFTFLAFGPFIVIMIGIAWLIHGFGFLIFKG